MKSLTPFTRCLIHREFTPTALKVALVVGSVLFMINHGSAFISGQMNRQRWLAAGLTYIVPYLVNIHGQYASKIRR